MFCGPLTIIQGHTSHFTVSCMSNFKTRTLVTNFISWVSLLMCVGFYRMCLRNQIQCIALFWRKLLRSAVQKFPEYSLSSEVSVTGSYLEPDESTLNRRTFIWSIIRAFEFIIIVPKKSTDLAETCGSSLYVKRNSRIVYIHLSTIFSNLQFVSGLQRSGADITVPKTLRICLLPTVNWHHLFLWL